MKEGCRRRLKGGQCGPNLGPVFGNVITFLNDRSCWEWDSTLRSSLAFIVFLLVTWYFEPFVLPLGLLLHFLRNFIVREVPHLVTAFAKNCSFKVQEMFFVLFGLEQLRSLGNPSVKEYESDTTYVDEDDDDADDKTKVTFLQFFGIFGIFGI